MKKWLLGDYEFIYNPSQDSESYSLQNVNNYSLTGVHAGANIFAVKTKNFSTKLYGSSIIITNETSLNHSYCDLNLADRKIYLTFGNIIETYNIDTLAKETTYLFSSANSVYGIAVDNITDPLNISIYVYGDNKIFKCNEMLNIQNYLLLSGNITNARSLTYGNGYLYTIHPKGSIYQINYSSNTSNLYYNLEEKNNNYYALSYDGKCFWYYDKNKYSLIQYLISDNNVINCINLEDLGINNIIDIVVKKVSNQIFLTTGNKLCVLNINTVNEKLYNLLKELKKYKVNLVDELGRVNEVVVTDVNINEKIANINKPNYDVDIKVMFL